MPIPLPILALRFVADSRPKARTVVLGIVSHEMSNGASPLVKLEGHTAFEIVWNTLGQTYWAHQFFRTIRPFLDPSWEEATCIVAFLGGHDIERIVSWSDMMDVEQVCEPFANLRWGDEQLPLTTSASST